MSQYVTKIACDRPTPISIEECEHSETVMSRYELIYSMAKNARKIQRNQKKDVIEGRLNVHDMKSPIIESMYQTKNGRMA